MITLPSPFLLGAETEVLPKRHLGFLGLVSNTQTTEGLFHSCSFKKTLRAKLSKALTEKLVPKTYIGSNRPSPLRAEKFFHSQKTSKSVLLLASTLYL